MKKAILSVALTLLLCFSLTANASGSISFSIDSVNTAYDGNTVIYTENYGGTIPAVDENYIIISVVPKFESEDSSQITDESVSEDSSVMPDISSDVSETPSGEVSLLPETSSDSITPDTSSGNGSIIPETPSGDGSIIPETPSGNEGVIPEILPSQQTSEYKYKVENVYFSAESREGITVSEGGFILVIPKDNDNSSAVSTSSRELSVYDIEKGTPVALHGVNLEENTLTEGAFVEFDLSEKELQGDIPQTSDNGMTAIFTVVAALSVLLSALLYRRRKIA